jgi:hypothetical protein
MCPFEYKGHIIKYFVNCCEKEGIIIYSLTYNLLIYTSLSQYSVNLLDINSYI